LSLREASRRRLSRAAPGRRRRRPATQHGCPAWRVCSAQARRKPS
jgi:hypothetical protein